MNESGVRFEIAATGEAQRALAIANRSEQTRLAQLDFAVRYLDNRERFAYQMAHEATGAFLIGELRQRWLVVSHAATLVQQERAEYLQAVAVRLLGIEGSVTQ